jgi:diguanylate cyclase (GGDEF)-like protein
MDQYRDALTGLQNYASMRIWTSAPWLNPPLPGAALIMLDVISLMQINHEFGHAFGDRVLAETAHRMQRTAGDRPLWRIGGDEFVIAMRVDGPDELRRFARALRIAIEEPIDGTSLGMWMGAAIASASSQVADELLRKAHLAMYQAIRQRTRELILAPDDTPDSGFGLAQ